MFKCFKEGSFNSALQLDDLQQSFSQSKSNFGKSALLGAQMTVPEMVCRNYCPLKFLEANQQEEIARLELKAQ